MKTPAEWTADILADLADLWRHMDEVEGPPPSKEHAASMVKAGCRLMLEAEPGTLTSGDAMAQATLLLSLVRAVALEHEAQKEKAS